MKTAMQELIERLENSGMPLGSYDYDIFEELLEKEKEQIKDAYHKGGYLLTKKPYGVFVKEVEEYYNQIYNL